MKASNAWTLCLVSCDQTVLKLWPSAEFSGFFLSLCFGPFFATRYSPLPLGLKSRYPTVLSRASSSASEAPLLWLLHVAWHQFASPFTLPMPSTHIHLPCLGLCLFSIPGPCSWSDTLLWNGTVWPLALGFFIQVSSHWPWPDLAVGHEMSDQLL